jgi:pyruvate kinase
MLHYLPMTPTKTTENLRIKHTKIVATLGPASSDPEVLTSMIRAGLNVVRCNMSHGSHDEHSARIATVREAMASIRKRVGILVDLAGPKIRIGEVENGSIELKPGSKVTLTTESVIGTPAKIGVNYPKLPAEVKKGGYILIEDGKKKLEVLSTNGTDEIICKVITGGVLGSKKGLNIPGAYLSIPALTDKDKKDVHFAIQQNADFIALSFVRTADDIHDLRKILKKGNSKALIIAKIETSEAIEQLEAIVEATDGIMVARGDLAVEIGAERVPVEQKRMIELARNYGKPVITATQMLDSMEKSPVPTRAEVSDIANAILDGTDAVMLSGESSIGLYPVESIAVMARVAQNSEPLNTEHLVYVAETQTQAITETIINLSELVDAQAFVCLTETGTTPRMLARFRPSCRIIAITPHEKIADQLTLSYAIRSVLHVFSQPDFATVENELNTILRDRFKYKKGDKVIVSAGFPMGNTGSTNSIIVHTIS